MTALFLSRVALRRDVPASALWRELVPSDTDRRTMASHRLLWTLFSDSRERERDFLWREVEPGQFYCLSERPPQDRHGLFALDTPKRFEPALVPGDRLRFSLRANATVARLPSGANGSKVRGKPCDVVMDALHKIPKGPDRGDARRAAAMGAGQAWLAAKGSKSGFRLASPADDDPAAAASCVHSYRTMRLDHRNSHIQIGVLDFEGILVVEDPAKLIRAIAEGFGRAKAFGCGLMLIRRA